MTCTAWLDRVSGIFVRAHRAQKRNPRAMALGFAVELLGRFELPTSSLPMTRSTDWAITASRNQLHYYSTIFFCVKHYLENFCRELCRPAASGITVSFEKKRRGPAPAKPLSALADMGFFAVKNQIIQIRLVPVLQHTITSLSYFCLLYCCIVQKKSEIS